MPAMSDKNTRDRLKEVRDRLADARSRRTEARKERDSAKEAFGEADFSEPGTKITETQAFKDAEQAVKTVGQIEDEINDLQTAETTILEMLGNRVEQNGGPSGVPGRAPAAAWNAHQLLANSEQYREAVEQGVFRSRNKFGTVDLGQIADRDHAMAFLAAGMMAASLPGAPAGSIGTPDLPAAVPPDFRGIIPPRVRRLTLLDILPTGTTDSNVVEYVQVTAIPSGAAETAELAAKPEAGITFDDDTANVRTIAAWVKAARQAMDDMAGLATLINTLLPYEVRRRVEAQILNGDGSGQNIKGLLRFSGIGAPSPVSGDNVADAILRAMTTVILSDSDPNFVALNPLSRQELSLMREGATDGSWKGEYLYGTPGTIANPTIWGLTMTDSRIIDQSHPLVGDSQGAAVLVREGLNVRTSDADQDDFTKNRVTLLAETRIAFPVWRPTAFAQATYTPR